MANFAGVDLALAVAEAGGLASLGCAALTPDRIRADVAAFRARSRRPLNLNFFCHILAPDDPERDRAWLKRMAPYFAELKCEPPALPLPRGHAPFGEAECAVVEELRPVYEELGTRLGSEDVPREITDVFAAISLVLVLAAAAFSAYFFRRAP